MKSMLVLLILAPTISKAAEFEAGIGPIIHERCHMDYCEFATIQVSVPVSVQRDGTMFAISGQTWGANYARTSKPSDEYARPPKSVEPKQPYLSMVFCSKVRPYVFSFIKDTGKWQADALKPGDDEAISGADESAYQEYWAACHHFFPKDAYDALVHKLAPKLGYHFQGGSPDENEQVSQPSDLMK